MQCILVLHAVYTGASRKIPVYSPENVIPLSGKKTHVTNEKFIILILPIHTLTRLLLAKT